MFTGIVREVGEVVEVAGDGEGRTLVVAAPGTAPTTAVGDSVAIDGVCLTAEASEGPRIRFHAVAETLARTTLGTLDAGAAVNVEPALRAGEPLGGHIVQGHVDDVGTILSVTEEGEGLRVPLRPSALAQAGVEEHVVAQSLDLERPELDRRRKVAQHRRPPAREDGCDDDEQAVDQAVREERRRERRAALEEE